MIWRWFFGARPTCVRSFLGCDYPESCEAYGECGHARRRELLRFDRCRRCGGAGFVDDPLHLDGFGPCPDCEDL